VVSLALASTTATFEIFLKLCASKSGFTPLFTCLAQTFVLVAFFVQIAAFATPAIAAVFLLKFFARITFLFGPFVASLFLAGLWTFFLVALRRRFETIEKIFDHAASVNLLLVTLYLLPILLTRDLNAAGRCAHYFAIGIYRLLPAVVRAEKTFLQGQFVHIALSAAGAKVNILVRTNDQRTLFCFPDNKIRVLILNAEVQSNITFACDQIKLGA
jgi:hypothetical protein